jgi:hypothetical protein
MASLIGRICGDGASAASLAVGLHEAEGRLARAIEDGGLAPRAGPAVGDVLADANGHELRSIANMDDALARGRLHLRFLRGADERRVDTVASPCSA